MNTELRKTLNRAGKSPVPGLVFIVSVLSLLLLGWLDYITGDYSLIIFYLLPVGLVAWYAKRLYAVLFCVLCLITRLIADEAGSDYVFSAPLLHYKNYVAEFLLLLFISLIITVVKPYLTRQQHTEE